VGHGDPAGRLGEIRKRFLLYLRFHEQRSFDAAVAIEKPLRGAKWSLVQFFRTLLQTEADAELFVQRFLIIAHDIEAAAFCRALRAEGTDDDVASGPNSGSDLPDIGGTLFRRYQKMKDRAVVPHVVSV
jgi:hypothetical protein